MHFFGIGHCSVRLSPGQFDVMVEFPVLLLNADAIIFWKFSFGLLGFGRK